MQWMKLAIFAAVLCCTAASVIKAPQLIDSRKKLQKRQEDDDQEGVEVAPIITAGNIEVYDVTTSGQVTTSSEELDNTISQEGAYPENEDDVDAVNKYCKCSSDECNCCRDFSLPIVPVAGPGCASLKYLGGDRMSVGIKFGNRVLANRVISGRRDTPICLPLPGGFSNFCGRIYGISKVNEDFKACLGLELRADDEVEAALRVSCFKFGPRGLKVTDAEPIPVDKDEDEDDDDEDDIFGFGGGDDEDEEDDDLLGLSDGADDEETETASDDDDGDDSVDYTGFSLFTGEFLDDLLGDDEDQPDRPAQIANRKDVIKRKKSKKNTKVKKTQEIIDSAKPAQNEVDGSLSPSSAEIPLSDETVNLPTSVEENVSAVGANSASVEDPEDDEESEEEGILGLLESFMSDDDDDDSDEDLEDESDNVSVQDEATKSEDYDDDEKVEDGEDELDDDEESASALAEVAGDDDDDDEEDTDEDEKTVDKTTTYAGLSLLGLRNFFSKFTKST